MADHVERLLRLHALLGGGTPQEIHTRLYGAFPAALGFSSNARDDSMFEAVLTLALLQAGKSGGETEFHKVYFLVPASISDGWVVPKFRTSAKHIFDRLKRGKSVAAVKHVGDLFKGVMLGSQVFTLPQEPDRWVAFGFSKTDPIPDWMRNKLLDFSETGVDLRPGV